MCAFSWISSVALSVRRGKAPIKIFLGVAGCDWRQLCASKLHVIGHAWELRFKMPSYPIPTPPNFCISAIYSGSRAICYTPWLRYPKSQKLNLRTGAHRITEIILFPRRLSTPKIDGWDVRELRIIFSPPSVTSGSRLNFGRGRQTQIIGRGHYGNVETEENSFSFLKASSTAPTIRSPKLSILESTDSDAIQVPITWDGLSRRPNGRFRTLVWLTIECRE